MGVGGRALGVFLLLLVSLIWSISSVVVQLVEKQGVDAFVLTYICNALFVIYWVPACLCPQATPRDEDCESLLEHEVVLGRWRKELRAATVLSPLWMLANASYNASLKTTSITSSTILSTTSSLWTLAFAAIAGVERATFTKVAAGFATILGAALVAWGDTQKHEHRDTLVGDGLALAAAALYGAYGTGLRLVHPIDSYVLFGYLGATNALLFAAPVAIYGFLSDSFSSLTLLNVGLVILKGLFDNALSDFLWAKAVVLTTPTLATLGLSLTVPLAFCIDAVSGKLDTQASSLSLKTIGAVTISVSFLLASTRDDPALNPAPQRSCSSPSRASRRGSVDNEDNSAHSPSESSLAFQPVAIRDAGLPSEQDPKHDVTCSLE